jgi:FkbM family methyltransferase
MGIKLLGLRLQRLAVALAYTRCWPALMLGVAPSPEHLALLRSLNIDGIIDVGANRGQFTLACRLARADVPVVAFEPIPAEAETFRKVHGKSPGVTLIESAIGETNGSATLHLSASADSSSLLPIGRRQVEVFADTAQIAEITVPVSRLDEMAGNWSGRSRQLLKLDVQGYELSVLRGAVDTLRSCAYVYAECSEVELYDGQALRSEIAMFLNGHGFAEPVQFSPYFHGGQLIQADYLFVRRGISVGAAGILNDGRKHESG